MGVKIQQLFLMIAEQESTQIDYTDCNTDVIVFMENGAKYVASFFSYKNIEKLRKVHQKTGAHLSGKYFQANNLVLIDNCSKSNVTKVVQYLIEEGDFQMIFKKISN